MLLHPLANCCASFALENSMDVNFFNRSSNVTLHAVLQNMTFQAHLFQRVLNKQSIEQVLAVFGSWQC